MYLYPVKGRVQFEDSDLHSEYPPVILPNIMKLRDPDKDSFQIMLLLVKLNQEDKITVLVITHDNAVAEYCRRRIFLQDGKIVSDTVANPS